MIGLLIFIGAFILIFVAGWLNNTPLMTMSFLLVLLSAAGHCFLPADIARKA